MEKALGKEGGLGVGVGKKQGIGHRPRSRVREAAARRKVEQEKGCPLGSQLSRLVCTLL